MQFRNTRTSWGALSRLLHWAMAGLILFQIIYGFYMVNFVENPLEQFPMYQIHKSWGFVALVLLAARLSWRLANRATPALPEMPRWQKACGAWRTPGALCADDRDADLGLADGLGLTAAGPFRDQERGLWPV